MGFQFTTAVQLVGSRTVTGYDKGNRPIYAEPVVSSPGWVLWPSSSTETVDAEDITTDLLEGFAPHGTNIDSIQQVIVPMFPGRKYEVTGTAWSYTSPFTGTAPGVSVRLKAQT